MIALVLIVLGVALLLAIYSARVAATDTVWVVVDRETEDLLEACRTRRRAELVASQAGDRFIVIEVWK